MEKEQRGGGGRSGRRRKRGRRMDVEKGSKGGRRREGHSISKNSPSLECSLQYQKWKGDIPYRLHLLQGVMEYSHPGVVAIAQTKWWVQCKHVYVVYCYVSTADVRGEGCGEAK